MRVLISGFGCTKQATKAGGSDLKRQVLTVGWAAIKEGPTAGNPYLRTVADLDLKKSGPIAKTSGSELCKGDSGGGTYVAGMNESTWNQRRLLGVNSAYAPGGSPSYIVSLASPMVLEFMRTWIKDQATDICGIPDPKGSPPNALCGKGADD